jgi:choline/ethanolamine kinase
MALLLQLAHQNPVCASLPQEYLEAETLKPSTMRAAALSPLIAQKVAAMHSLHPEGLDTAPQLFNIMQRWYAMAAAGADTASYGGAVDLRQLQERIVQLQARLARVYSPSVFCHNDLQYGNLMYKRNTTSSTGTLYLIDYEYACYNPRGFDLGNHFCEWGADYHSDTPHLLSLDKFPSAAEQERFCRAYLEHSTSSTSSSSRAPLLPAGEAVSAAAVAALAREARHYSLASHLLWACWGLAQSRVSSIAFDYVGYAAGRLQAYEHFAALWGEDAAAVA